MSQTLSKRYLETQQCELPDTLPPGAEDQVWFDHADPQSPRSPAPFVPVSVQETCPAIIQSGVHKGQACGKPVTETGFCKRHPPSTEERPTKRPKLTSYTQGRCVCKTQKGDICGAVVKGGGLVCKRHANCPLPDDLPADFVTEPSTAPVQPETEADVVMQIEPEPEFDAQEQRELNEPVLILPDTAEPPEPMSEEPSPEMIEARLLDQEEWSTHRITNHREMMHLLETTTAVDIDERQFRYLEMKIRACFE
jgi:hypothetical protein